MLTHSKYSALNEVTKVEASVPWLLASASAAQKGPIQHVVAVATDPVEKQREARDEEQVLVAYEDPRHVFVDEWLLVVRLVSCTSGRPHARPNPAEETHADQEQRRRHAHQPRGTQRREGFGHSSAGHRSDRAADTEDREEPLALFRRVNVCREAPELGETAASMLKTPTPGSEATERRSRRSHGPGSRRRRGWRRRTNTLRQ